MIRLFPLFLSVLLLGTVALQSASGHVVQQLYGEFQPEREKWRIELWFDAGYADPATCADPASPQPTRAWLLGLTRAEQIALVGQAEAYLRDILHLKAQGGGEVVWDLSCPDLEVDPANFPRLLNDGAYFRLRIEPATAPGRDGLEVALADGGHPDLVLKTGIGEQAAYLTLRPGECLSLLESGGVEGRSAAAEAFRQGFLHVVPMGLDHLLFVLGIFLLCRRWRPLLAQSLAFTAAHTITLGLAAAGWVKVPASVVEPLIALSIAAVAVENLFVREVRRGRLELVFVFGLVHGLGFAGVLATWIPPGDGFLTGLLTANLGVEVAQVLILLAAWTATLVWHRRPLWETVRRASCVVLALVGLWWFVARIAGF
ncbi:MAG: HupE/UreJ family protein [Verrucomicrobia bacterium]|nr:MAG: HupE/UreJ family protein [Verrucomicrobiota bacterium]TAF24665.1 MAG: HupE/UreJ family protein [Verrucomicrobiota bacterium]TAF40399.1 MAG: HupE/UreJ family protein [Verrucomicrobiota bacterium]